VKLIKAADQRKIKQAQVILAYGLSGTLCKINQSGRDDYKEQ
jgi:hypothetical protein